MFNSRRILIVEDEPFVVIELVEAVERSGGAVVGPVPTVAEALALLDQHKIDAARRQYDPGRLDALVFAPPEFCLAVAVLVDKRPAEPETCWTALPKPFLD